MICEKCGRPISYNSYFKAYFCNECGAYYTRRTELTTRIVAVKYIEKTKIQDNQKAVCHC